VIAFTTVHGQTNEELVQEIIEELTQEMRCWDAGVRVRRAVRFLVKRVWMDLIDGKVRGRTREDLAEHVKRIAPSGGWLPCDCVEVFEGIRLGCWKEIRASMAGPRCVNCRQKEDVMRNVVLFSVDEIENFFCA